MNFRSRTVPSPCSAQTTQLFYTNDEGVFFVADAASADPPGTWTSSNSSPSNWIPREVPFMLPFSNGIQTGPVPRSSFPSPISPYLPESAPDDVQRGHRIFHRRYRQRQCRLRPDAFRKERGRTPA